MPAKTKKIFLTLIVFLGVFALASAVKVKAVTIGNATGWIYDGADDGAGNSSGLGWISVNNTNAGAGGAISYGLDIPSTDGAVTGYVWSENVGAIDFNPQSNCGSAYTAASCQAPDGSSGGVSRSGNNLVGWARLVEIAKASAVGNSGGWDGWIHMNGPSYGVSIDNTTGKLSGYAWSDELGTISFRGNVGSGIEYGAQIPAAPACVPNYQNYQCITVSNGNTCNASNAGQTITTGTPLCSRSDTNNCSNDPLPTNTDCDNNGKPCDTNQTKICPQLKQATGWQEVAP